MTSNINGFDLAKSLHNTTVFIDSNKRDIEQFNTTICPTIKHLETIVKVLSVAIAIITFLMLPAFAYLPAWVSLGVGVPTLLLLSYLVYKLKKKNEAGNHTYQTRLNLHGMLHDSSFEALNPEGLGTFQAVAPLSKREPASPADVQRAMMTLNLDNTFHMKKHASVGRAQNSLLGAQWMRLEEAVKKAKRFLLSGDIDSYVKEIAKAKREGLSMGGIGPPLSRPLPSESAHDRLHAFDILYKKFNQLNDELDRLHEEGKILFGDTFCKEWITHREKAQGLKAEVKAFLATTPTTEWLKARAVLKSKLPGELANLIKQTKELNKIIKPQINNHPVTRVEAIKEELAQFDQEILKEQTIADLREWIDDNSNDTKSPIREVIRLLPHSNEVDKWLEIKGYGKLNHDTVEEVCQRNDSMRKKLEKAQASIVELESNYLENISKSSSSEVIEHVTQAVTAYRKDVMVPLKKYKTSKWKILKGALWNKQKAHLFERVVVPKIRGFPRSQKITELTINKQWKENNRNIVRIQGVNKYGVLLIASLVSFVFLVVTIFFGSNPWVVWGTAATTLLIKGSMLCLDLLLKKLDDKKQLERQKRLINRPLITGVPGDVPTLQSLKEVQGKDCLDGVTCTQSRLRADDGEKKVFSNSTILRILKGEEVDTDKEGRIILLKKNLKKMAIKEWGEAKKLLQKHRNHLLSCRGKVKDEKLEKRIADVDKAINSIPPLPVGKRKKSDYVKLVEKRDQCVQEYRRIEKRFADIAQEKRLAEELMEGVNRAEGLVKDLATPEQLEGLSRIQRMAMTIDPQKDWILTQEMKTLEKALEDEADETEIQRLLLKLENKTIELNKLWKKTHVFHMLQSWIFQLPQQWVDLINDQELEKWDKRMGDYLAQFKDEDPSKNSLLKKGTLSGS